MAKKTSVGITLGSYRKRAKRKRPGIYAKTKTGTHKGSKNYVKLYRGQGK
jgi:hypothetical protein